MIELLIVGLIVWAGWTKWDRTHSPAASREEAIAQIARSMREHGITPEELAQARELPQAALAPKRGTGNIATKIFTILGGIFVLGGIGAYIAMFWPTMSSGMRIFITLGVGLCLSAFSCVAMKEGKYPRIILPVIVLAALIEATGWCVFVDEMFPHGTDVRKAACFVFAVMALQEWGVFSVFKRTSLFFFAALFSYGFLESALELAGMREEFIWMLLGGSLMCVSDWAAKTRHGAVAGIGFFFAAIWFNTAVYHYIGRAIGWPEGAMAAGLSLSALAYGLQCGRGGRLPALFYFIGSSVFYAGLFEWVWHTPYELLYVAVAVAMMYVHALLESRAILATSTLAILGFIGYYTEEHFVNSVGWPVALILLGAAFIAVGAMAVRIGKKDNR